MDQEIFLSPDLTFSALSSGPDTKNQTGMPGESSSRTWFQPFTPKDPIYLKCEQGCAEHRIATALSRKTGILLKRRPTLSFPDQVPPDRNTRRFQIRTSFAIFSGIHNRSHRRKEKTGFVRRRMGRRERLSVPDI